MNSVRVCRTRSRSLVIVVYWGPNWPNCVKMRDFLTYWHWMSVTDWVVGSYGQFAKNTQSYSMIWWPKVTNAKSLCEYEWYCAFPTSIRTCQEMQSCRLFLSRSIILPSRRSWSMLALTALSPGSIRQQENQSHARSMRCCHPILQERPLPAICTKMSRTKIWSVPLPVTKKTAKPSHATAKSTRIWSGIWWVCWNKT